MAADSVEYYGDITFWNSFTAVARYQNRLATGDADMSWYQHLLREHGPFERALSLNCGNGWVDRDLVRIGVVREVVGIDISERLVADARREAAALGAPLTYQVLDINKSPLPPGPFDLVVNHAAAHHITHIDRTFRDVCRIMPEDGWFVSWDYVGPHRNQYTAQQWEAAWLANQKLPERFRQQMRYPHLPTMIAGDPTEAVHSELIMPTMRRYFHIDRYRNLGGGVAYPVMTHNHPLYEVPLDEVAEIVDQLIAADEAFVEAHPDQTLFAYVIARPNHDVLGDAPSLHRWTEEEDAREAAAQAKGGTYYPPTVIAATEYGERPGPVPIHSLPTRIVALHLASRLPFIGSLARRVRNLLRRRRPVRP